MPDEYKKEYKKDNIEIYGTPKAPLKVIPRCGITSQPVDIFRNKQPHVVDVMVAELQTVDIGLEA
jgi:hypothetical protein